MAVLNYISDPLKLREIYEDEKDEYADSGDIVAGLASGYSGLKSSTQNAAAALARTFGADSVAQRWERYADENAARAAGRAADRPTFEELVKRPSIGKAIDWLQFSAGQQAPLFAEMAGASIIGGALGGIPGATAGAARSLAPKVLPQAVRSALTADKVGKFAGTYLPYAVATSGENYSQLRHDSKATGTLQQRALASLGTGATQALIGTAFGPEALLARAAGPTKFGWKSALKELGTQTLGEGLGETAEQLLGHAVHKYGFNPNKELDPMELANAFVTGSAIGGMYSAPMIGIQQAQLYRKEKETKKLNETLKNAESALTGLLRTPETELSDADKEQREFLTKYVELLRARLNPEVSIQGAAARDVTEDLNDEDYASPEAPSTPLLSPQSPFNTKFSRKLQSILDEGKAYVDENAVFLVEEIPSSTDWGLVVTSKLSDETNVPVVNLARFSSINDPVQLVTELGKSNAGEQLLHTFNLLATPEEVSNTLTHLTDGHGLATDEGREALITKFTRALRDQPIVKPEDLLALNRRTEERLSAALADIVSNKKALLRNGIVVLTDPEFTKKPIISREISDGYAVPVLNYSGIARTKDVETLKHKLSKTVLGRRFILSTGDKAFQQLIDVVTDKRGFNDPEGKKQFARFLSIVFEPEFVNRLESTKSSEAKDQLMKARIIDSLGPGAAIAVGLITTPEERTRLSNEGVNDFFVDDLLEPEEGVESSVNEEGVYRNIKFLRKDGSTSVVSIPRSFWDLLVKRLPILVDGDVVPRGKILNLFLNAVETKTKVPATKLFRAAMHAKEFRTQQKPVWELEFFAPQTDSDGEPLPVEEYARLVETEIDTRPSPLQQEFNVRSAKFRPSNPLFFTQELQALLNFIREKGYVLVGRMDNQYFFAPPKDALRFFRATGVISSGKKDKYNATQLIDDVNVLERLGVLLKKQSGYEMVLDLSRFADTEKTTRHDDSTNDGTIAIMRGVPLAQGVMARIVTLSNGQQEIEFDKGIMRPQLALRKWKVDPETGKLVITGRLGGYEKESLNESLQLGRKRRPLDKDTTARFYRMFPPSRQRNGILNLQQVLFSFADALSALKTDTLAQFGNWTVDLELTEDSKKKAKAGTPLARLIDENAVLRRLSQLLGFTSRAYVIASELVKEPGQVVLLPETYNEFNEGWRKVYGKDLQEGDMIYLHRDPALPDTTSVGAFKFVGIAAFREGNTNRGIVLNPKDPQWALAAGDFDGDSGVLIVPTPENKRLLDTLADPNSYVPFSYNATRFGTYVKKGEEAKVNVEDALIRQSKKEDLKTINFDLLNPRKLLALKKDEDIVALLDLVLRVVVPRSSSFSGDIGTFVRLGQKFAELGQLDGIGLFPNPKYREDHDALPLEQLIARNPNDAYGEPALIPMKLGEVIALVAQASVSAKKKDYNRGAVNVAIDLLKETYRRMLSTTPMVNPLNFRSLLPRFTEAGYVDIAFMPSGAGGRYLREGRRPISFLVSLFGNIKRAPTKRAKGASNRKSNVDTIDFNRLSEFERLRWRLRNEVNQEEFDRDLLEQVKDFFKWTPSETKFEQQRELINYASWLLQMMFVHLETVHSRPEYKEAKDRAFESIRIAINERISEYNRTAPKGSAPIQQLSENTSQRELFRFWVEAPYSGLNIGTPLEMKRFIEAVYRDPKSRDAIQYALNNDREAMNSESYRVRTAWMFEAPLHVELAFRALEHGRLVQELGLLATQYHLPTLLKSKATRLANMRPDVQRERVLAETLKRRYAAVNERLRVLIAENEEDEESDDEIDALRSELSEITREAEFLVLLGAISPESMIAFGSETMAVNILSGEDFIRISESIHADVGVKAQIFVGLDNNKLALSSALIRPGLYLRNEGDPTRFDLVVLTEDGTLEPVTDPRTGAIINVNSPAMNDVASTTGGLVYLSDYYKTGAALKGRFDGRINARDTKRSLTMIVKTPSEALEEYTPKLDALHESLRTAVETGQATLEFGTLVFNSPAPFNNPGLFSSGRDTGYPVIGIDPFRIGGEGNVFNAEELKNFFMKGAGRKYFAAFFRPGVSKFPLFVELMLVGIPPQTRRTLPFEIKSRIANLMAETFRLDYLYKPGLDAVKLRNIMYEAAKNISEQSGKEEDLKLVEGIFNLHKSVTEREQNARKVGAKVTRTGEYEWDIKLLRELYANKGWTTPKVEGVLPLPEDAFSTEEEFLKFIALHEAYHKLKPNYDDEIPLAENENMANGFAMQMLLTPEEEWSQEAKTAWSKLKRAVNKEDGRQTYDIQGAPAKDSEYEKEKFVSASSIDRPGVKEKFQKLARKLLDFVGLEDVTVVVGDNEAMFDAIRMAEIAGVLPKHIAEFKDAVVKGKANDYRGFTLKFNGTYFIWINDRSSKVIKDGQLDAPTLAAFVHEIGHVIKYAAYDSADAATKNAVVAAYEAWKTKAQETLVTKSLSAKKKEYAVDFDEWMADQIAGWLVTDKEPRTLAEAFFNNVAKLLKALWKTFQRLGERNGQPIVEKSVVEFVKSIKRPINVAPSATAPTGEYMPPPEIDSSFRDPAEIAAEMEALAAIARGEAETAEKARKEQEELAKKAARRFDRLAKIQNWADRGGWGDLKELQAIADEVESGLEDMLAPEDVKMLKEMAGNRIMQRRLASLLGGSREILEALRNPNKAVAYMYVLSVSGMMTPPDPVKGPFKTLQDFMMAHTSAGIEAYTSEVIEAISNLRLRAEELGPGRPPLFPPDSPAARLYKERNARYVKGLVGILQRGHELYRKLTSWMIDVPYQRLLDTQNPVLIHFARSVQEMAWELGVLKSAGYIERTHVLYQIEANKASKILKELSEEDRELLRMRLWGQSKKSNEKVNKAYTEIRKLLAHLHQYETRGGLDVPARTDYWPLIPNHEYISSNLSFVVDLYTSNDFLVKNWEAVKEQYINWIIKNNYSALEIKRIKELELKEFVKTYLLEDESSALPGWGLKQRPEGEIHTPGFRFMNPRLLDFLLHVKDKSSNDPEAAKIQEGILSTLEKDPNKILHRYIRSSIKRTEYHQLLRKIGGDEGWAGMVARARKHGATNEDIKLAVKYMDAVLGQAGIVERDTINNFIDKHAEMFPFLKKFKAREGQILNDYVNDMRSFLLMWQAVSKLTLSAFASFVDPFGQLLHTGDFRLFLQSMKITYQGLYQLAKASPRVVKLYKNMLESGTLEEAMTHEDLMSTYFGPEVQPWAQKILTAFFSINGVQWITQKTRHLATQAGLLALRDWKIAAEQGDEKALRRLMEHGVTPDQILLDEEGDVILIPEAEIEAGTPEGERAISVYAALHRFVNESQVRPDPTNRTLLGSNPYYSLVTQWKNFIVAFDNQLLRPAIYRASEDGSWLPLIYGALTMVPVMLFADMLRDAIKTSLDDDDDNWRPRWKDNWTLQEHIMYAIQRSGFYGRQEIVYDIMNQLTRGDAPRAATEILGPAASDVRQVMQKGFDRSMLPGADLWKDWGPTYAK